jgi:hypothetical protein
MAYTTAEGRQQLLDLLGDAIGEVGYALASLGAAYEQLDQASADSLEDQLFGPVQRAYGRAKRTYGSFADRSGLSTPAFAQDSPGPPSTGAKGFIENAVHAIGAANGHLQALQDSDELIEVGDAELRKDVAELRGLIDDFPQRARELTRRLGR